MQSADAQHDACVDIQLAADLLRHLVGGLVEMRERDLKLALEDEHYKRLAYEQFTRLQKKAYPVVESNTKEALACLLYTSRCV